jgi:cation:H+ antiporter
MWIGYEFRLFVLGLVALLWGAERLVDASTTVAKKAGVSPLIIGITILSVGTSLPEIATSIVSFVTGHADVAMGNIIGSELVQITLILGLVALIRPLQGERKEIIFYGASMLGAVFLALLVVQDNVIHWYEGLFLCVAYCLFLFFVVRKDRNKLEKEHIDEAAAKRPWSKLIMFIILGFVLTIVGSKIMVDSSVNIAYYFNVSEYVIAVFLVGLGTSIPELVVSGIAAWKKEYGMSVGNILGSNITDPTFSFGFGALFVGSAALNPVAGKSILILMAIFVIVLGIFAFKKKISRVEALFIILLYIGSFWLF